jgi:hypothetical protein
MAEMIASSYHSMAGGKHMLAAIGVVILVLWLLGFLAFHITVGFIHLLPVLAIVLIIMHFARRGAAA